MNKDSATNTFGVPVGDTSIPGMLAMQKKLHHNARLIPRKRSRLFRVMLGLVSLLLLMPGAFFIYVAYLAYLDTGMMALIIPGTLGLIFIGGGIAGILSSFKPE